MKRGEVWWVNFGPGVGGEIQNTASSAGRRTHLHQLEIIQPDLAFSR